MQQFLGTDWAPPIRTLVKAPSDRWTGSEEDQTNGFCAHELSYESCQGGETCRAAGRGEIEKKASSALGGPPRRGDQEGSVGRGEEGRSVGKQKKP